MVIGFFGLKDRDGQIRALGFVMRMKKVKEDQLLNKVSQAQKHTSN